MGLGSLNYLAVIAAAIASFVFGGIWYNVFSKQWMEAVGMSPERMQKERGSVGLYVLAFVGSAGHGVDAGRHPPPSGARGGLPTTLWNGVVSARLHLARLRHHHHGGQLRLSRRQACR